MRARMEAVAASFERLSGREQVMVLLLVVAFLGAVLGFGGYFVSKDLDKRKKRIAAQVEQLKEIGNLKGDYQRRLADQNRLVAEVRQNQNLRILTYLEELARQAGVDLDNAAERPGSPTGSEQVREEAAEVNVNNVSMDRLHKFLKLIEGGNRLVQVRQLKIRQRFADKEKLDATITVGTFKPASSG